MAFRNTSKGRVDIEPSKRELQQKIGVRAFEILRREHVRISNEVRTGQLQRSWEVLQLLAHSAPLFLLDWSFEYSDESISRKLSQHIVYSLRDEQGPQSPGGLETLPFSDLIGDDIMVRAALNWSPRDRFQIEDLHGKNGPNLGVFLGELAQADPIFFNALGIALDFIQTSGGAAPNLAASLAEEMKTKRIVPAKQPPGKRPKKETVYRRLGVRLFLHEMRSLGFPIGPNDGAMGAKTACDAAWIALKELGKNPPSVQTLRQDWQQWKYKDT